MAENNDEPSAHNYSFIQGLCDLQSDGREKEPVFYNKDAGETLVTDDCLKPMREEWMEKEPLVSGDAQNIGRTEIIAEDGNRSYDTIEVKTEEQEHLGSQSAPDDVCVKDVEVNQKVSAHDLDADKHILIVALDGSMEKHQEVSKSYSNMENRFIVLRDSCEENMVHQEVAMHDSNACDHSIVEQELQQDVELEQKVPELPNSDAEDEKEKVMPQEIQQKIYSIVTTLEKVAEEDKEKCCCCKCSVSFTVDCLNICCLPQSCKCCKPCQKDEEDDDTEATVYTFTETLQKGSEAGRAIFKEIIFPLIRPFTRDLIAISEFLVGLVGLILSIVAFSLGNNAAYNILHLSLAILSTVLGFIDMVVSLKFSSAFAKMIKSLRNHTLGGTATDTEASNSKDEDSDQKKEPSFLKKGWDTGRILISEAILYPLLICDLIEFIVDKGYEVSEPTDIINLVLFIISLLSLIFYVYIARLGVLIAMVIHLYKCRTVNSRQMVAISKWSSEQEVCSKTTEENNELLDPTIAKNGLKFQIYFVVHVMGQMAAQIMMIVAISLKIFEDNLDKTLNSPLHISGQLWFMLCAGYIMPFLGILSFFIPTFYWVYEHENGLCIDFLNLLNMPGIDHFIFPNGEEMKEAYASIRNIAEKLNFGNQLREDFERLRNIGFCKKLTYAFRNPFLVVACLAYSCAQFAFMVIVIIGLQRETIGTIVYYVLSIVIGIFANMYVFLVAAVWMAVIVAIIVVIAIIIAIIACLCALCLLGAGGSRSNE